MKFRLNQIVKVTSPPDVNESLVGLKAKIIAISKSEGLPYLLYFGKLNSDDELDEAEGLHSAGDDISIFIEFNKDLLEIEGGSLQLKSHANLCWWGEEEAISPYSNQIELDFGE